MPPLCPNCGAVDTWPDPRHGKLGVYVCRGCRGQFTIKPQKKPARPEFRAQGTIRIYEQQGGRESAVLELDGELIAESVARWLGGPVTDKGGAGHFEPEGRYELILRRTDA